MSAQSIDWTFETERVRGRLVAEGDVDLYVGLYTDASVMRHIADVLSADEAAATFAKAVRHNANPAARARYWHLSHQRTAQPLGVAALVRDASVTSRGELGLMLLPHAQHTGAGMQVLACVIDGALSQRWRLGVNEILSRHAMGNIGVGRLLASLGFKPFEIGTPGSLGWRLTEKAWRAQLVLRASNPHYRQ